MFRTALSVHVTPSARVTFNAVACSSGEPWYIRKLMDKYHEAAAAKNIRIVPTCGYDSIPSDIGTFFLAQHAREKLNK